MNRTLPASLPEAEWRARDGLTELCAALGAAQGEARYVGGAVRDSLLGLPVKDIDIATLHLPPDVIARVEAAGFKAVPTGLAHGTVTAVVRHHPVEITTLRRDVETFGRHATVAFGTDWRDDASRRDFTINALYADPLSGALYDYFDGLADLAAGRVRFIGDPRARIDEDYLRILRFFRFTARFGALDRASADYAACIERAPGLKALSRERIADELTKLLSLPDPAGVMHAMVEDGILAQVLPEITSNGVAALERLIAAEHAANVAPDALRRLVALLPRDADVAGQVGARLRLSNKARARIRTAIAPIEADSPAALAYRAGVPSAIDRILLGRDFALDDISSLKGWEPPRLPLSGGDLIAMGLPAGPVVAKTLQQLETQWIEAGFPGVETTRALAGQLVGAVLRSYQ